MLSARLFCPWDSSGRNTGVGFHALLEYLPDPGIKPASLTSPAKAVLCLISCVRLFATPWTVACQAPLSMEILQGGIVE